MLGQPGAKTGQLHCSLSTHPVKLQGVLGIHGAGIGGAESRPRQMLGQLQKGVLTLHTIRLRNTWTGLLSCNPFACSIHGTGIAQGAAEAACELPAPRLQMATSVLTHLCKKNRCQVPTWGAPCSGAAPPACGTGGRACPREPREKAP